MPKIINYHRVTIESPKWGKRVGYSKSANEFNDQDTFLTLFDSPRGLDTFSVRWADIETLRVEAIFEPSISVNIGEINVATSPCVCRYRYKGKTVGELIDLTIKSIDRFQETGDSQRHREELAIIREEMKISHSLNRY
ncbi:hypothetical protein I4990_00860 [Providencia alcalifaciens]|uniref:hypothetical protein n=1 Tax=Providencia alcalifaciens TaxID=126385 RepID=UPI0018C66ECF|nr:hypothetical protein [Providencia alcalifaciens]MBG5881505.1 hypothetical protein [Providencia alcalifaciens]